MKSINHNKNNSCIIGVHIRRGDYNNWVNGRYYYDDKFYLNLINKLKLIFKPKYEKIIFLLCSDEDINLSFYNKRAGKNIYKGLDQEIEDLYCLSKCDYLIGPPSTYTRWASIYGSVPLYHIFDKDKEFTLDDFEIMSD